MRCKFCNDRVEEITVYFFRVAPVPGNFRAFRHVGDWKECSLKREIVYKNEVIPDD